MGFDYIGNGSPSANNLPMPGTGGPAEYLDAQSGVVYVQSGKGWQIPLVSAADGLVAHAGGGQANALPITTWIARFITVGTAADSAVLPAGLPGMTITVSNAAATNSMNVFPATGEIINALSANTAFAVAAGKTCEFFCAKTGQWHTVLSA